MDTAETFSVRNFLAISECRENKKPEAAAAMMPSGVAPASSPPPEAEITPAQITARMMLKTLLPLSTSRKNSQAQMATQMGAVLLSTEVMAAPAYCTP